MITNKIIYKIMITNKTTLGILLIILISMNIVFITAFSSNHIPKEKTNSQVFVNEIIQDNNETQAKQQESEELNDGVTESEAKEIALKEVDGKVLSIDIEKEGGRILYEVEIESGNDIAEVEIDSETGKILEVEWEDDDEDDDN